MSRIPAPRRSDAPSSVSVSGIVPPTPRRLSLSASSSSYGANPPSAIKPSSFKRSAADAGLENQDSALALARRQLAKLQSQLKHTDRSFGILNSREADLERKLQEETRIGESVREQNRRIVADEEKREKERGAREDRADSELKRIYQELSTTRLQLSEVRASQASLESEHSTLASESRSNKEAHARRLQAEAARADEAQTELEIEKDKSLELSEELRIATEQLHLALTELDASKREDEDKRTDVVVREELHRQAKHLNELNLTLSSQKKELEELRSRRDNVEATLQQHKHSENAWQEKYLNMEQEIERLKMENISLRESSTIQSDHQNTTDAAAHARLLRSNNDQIAIIQTNETEIRALHKRLEQLGRDSAASISSLKTKLEAAERELRWAQEGRKAAEVKIDVKTKEIDMLRRIGTKNPTSESNASTIDDLGQIKRLEETLEKYKAALEVFEADSRDAESRVASGLGYVKLEEMEKVSARLEQLQADFAEATSAVEEIKQSHSQLEKINETLEARVGSGEFNTAFQKVFEFSANPASQSLAIRQATLDALRAENKALLESWKTPEAAAEGGGLVPRLSYDSMAREKDAAYAQLELRLLRLKTVFQAKSSEFLDAVQSLLGYRMTFSDDGGIRLSSIYAPKGKAGVIFKFSSQEGHYGTMAMTGSMARGLEDQRKFWVDERQSIPCFLAQVSMEVYEMTTRGKAAGWTGPENE